MTDLFSNAELREGEEFLPFGQMPPEHRDGFCTTYRQLEHGWAVSFVEDDSAWAAFIYPKRTAS